MILLQHLAAAVWPSKTNGLINNSLLPDSAGQSQLFYAVHGGNDKFVKELITEPKLIHQVDSNGRGLLTIAVARSNLKITNILLNAGSDICDKDVNGITPLHLATKCPTDVMETVFSKLNAHNVDITDSSGRTALHWAAVLARETACRCLLQAGANPAKLDQNRRTPLHWLSVSDNVEHTPAVATLFLRNYPDLVRWQDMRGATPFHLAACSGNSELLGTLLEFADRDTINRADNLFRTPLHYACSLGHAKITAQLLQFGAKINVTDCEGSTPVHLAAYWNHVECLSVLTEKGGPSLVSTLCDTSGLSPLYWAVSRRNFDAARYLCSITNTPPSSLLLPAAANGDDAMVDLLLSNNVRVFEDLDTRTSSTALIYAAYHGHVTVMMSLIYRGKANPRQTDLRGRTPLHWAAMSGSSEACRFLLEAGCPHDAAEYLGCTALHCAAFSAAECVKVLLRCLPVECKDRYGFTPLHWACLGRNAASTKLLLAAGAHVNALGRTRDRQTPMDCALRRNATEAAELLIAAGGMTAHGLKEYSAIRIQSMWRGYRVRRTIKVVRKHESRIAKSRIENVIDHQENIETSPFHDGVVDAIYYGMGKNSTTGSSNGESSPRSENAFGEMNSNSFNQKSGKVTDEVAPPILENNNKEENDTVAPASRYEIERKTSNINSQPANQQPKPFENTTISLGGLAANLPAAKKRRPSVFKFGEVSLDDHFDETDDDELTEEELQQKYYRMTEEQIILQEAAEARKLRVAEMQRVEALRIRFYAATIIQRCWIRYKNNKKSTQTQKLTARQMRLRAGEHAWRRQMAAITLQNAWRKHHRLEMLKVVHTSADLQQVQSPLSNMMRSTRQAVLVSAIYRSPVSQHKPQSAYSASKLTKSTAKTIGDTSKPRPAAVSYNFAHRQYTGPVITACSQKFGGQP